MADDGRRRGSHGSTVNAAAAAAVLLIVAFLALQPVNSPPPAIAELAPQPQKQITEAPQEQSSSFGKGAEGGECAGSDCGGGGGAATTVPVTAPPVTISRARVRRCVGNPPRQIEDPQSPPCVAFWEGDNGGATTKGVTRNEIRIAVPEWNNDIHPPIEAFFNQRFEFYGRRLRLLELDTTGAEPEQQQSDAARADEELGVFASMSGAEGGGYFFHRELVRRKIISTTHFTKASRAEMTRSAPYLWQYPMAVDDVFSNLGEWACKRLHGMNAVHAGSGELQSQPRKFGIVLTKEHENEVIDANNLVSELDRCGAPHGDVIVINNTVPIPTIISDAVLSLEDQGATTVFCLCHIVFTPQMMTTATGQGYFPEWLLSTYSLQDHNYLLQAGPRGQLDSAFGLTFIPMQHKRDNEPSYWAEREGDHNCCTSESAPYRANSNVQYRQLLQLASGIQGAGPRLTPETFAAALHAMKFPNPPHPIMAGHVGFPGNGYAMTIDGAEWFWSSSGTAPNGGSGAMCYVDGGARHRKGAWPQGGDPFFKDGCNSGA